jgi:hypothetical protein
VLTIQKISERTAKSVARVSFSLPGTYDTRLTYLRVYRRVAHISILAIEFINKPKDKQSLFVVDLMQSAGFVLGF